MACLVCGGNRDESCGLTTRATVMKGVSVHILDSIVDSQDLQVMCRVTLVMHLYRPILKKRYILVADRRLVNMKIVLQSLSVLYMVLLLVLNVSVQF